VTTTIASTPVDPAHIPVGDGKLVTSSPRAGEVTVDGAAVTRYHYHVTRESPYTVGCFRGTPAAIR